MLVVMATGSRPNLGLLVWLRLVIPAPSKLTAGGGECDHEQRTSRDGPQLHVISLQQGSNASYHKKLFTSPFSWAYAVPWLTIFLLILNLIHIHVVQELQIRRVKLTSFGSTSVISSPNPMFNHC